MAADPLMRSILTGAVRFAREAAGQPVHLERWLADFGGQLAGPVTAGKRTMALSDVADWSRMGCGHPELGLSRKPGELRGWRRGEAGDYRPATRHCEALMRLTRSTWIDAFTCDIRAIEGLSASKADLSAYTSTDAFAEERCSRLIAGGGIEQLKKVLAHPEIRLIHGPGKTSDHLVVHDWDGRVFLSNRGEMHHLMAAKYLASRQEIALPLETRLKHVQLDAGAVQALRSEFAMFVIPAVAERTTVRNRLHDALAAYGATHYTCSMPPPDRSADVLLLPRAEHRSLVVAEMLWSAGLPDLNEHLGQLLTRQWRPGDLVQPDRNTLEQEYAPMSDESLDEYRERCEEPEYPAVMYSV